jgi:8-oxo-dGTP pyrophosphatase MutT (NUDIX family)
VSDTPHTEVDEGPTIRSAVRALVLDESGRILLFQGELRGRPPWWFAPGGAVEPGETDTEALIREVAEETGLVVDPATLSSPVWTRDYLFQWEGKFERHRERFFLIQITKHEVDTSRREPDEASVIRKHRWWHLVDIQSSAEQFSPVHLDVYLAPLLDGKIPDEPVAVGE